ncbi:MAG: hypothetical protein ACFFA0_06025 [Promethearchaeota archaeon]
MMDIEEFVEKLNQARDLMIQEKYKDAIKIINILKNEEKANNDNFDYALTHQLYQLDSNCRSAFQQQVILTHLNKFLVNKKSITFKELNQELKDKSNLIIGEAILRREIELLILRNLLKCELKGNQLIFSSL